MSYYVQYYPVISYLNLNSNDFALFTPAGLPLAQLTLRLGPSFPFGLLGTLFVLPQHACIIHHIYFSPLFLFSLLNTLLCVTVLVLLDRFSIFSRNFVNMLPCRGFVKKSVSMSLVEQCSSFTSPFLLVCNKKSNNAHQSTV